MKTKSPPSFNASLLSRAQIETLKDEVLDFFDDGRRKFPPALGLTIYQPQLSDVIITTFPKAGTTLTQQLVYQVCVFGGDASPDDPHGDAFTDICDKVPWLNYSHLVETPKAESSSTPRLYKTHSPAWRFTRGRQRHVVVLRDPAAFASSWLDFSFGCFPEIAERVGMIVVKDEDGESDESKSVGIRQMLFDDVYARHVIGTQKAKVDETDAFDVTREEGEGEGDGEEFVVGPWFKWARGWTDRAKLDMDDGRSDKDKSVLILFYEDMVRDTEKSIAKVAAFLDVTLSCDDVTEIRRKCSREYMMSGGQFLSKWDARVLGVDALSAKVLPERRDGFKTMSVSKEEELETRRQMKTVLGCDSYEEFKKRLGK